jgi:hypothetical protein
MTLRKDENNRLSHQMKRYPNKFQVFQSRYAFKYPGFGNFEERRGDFQNTSQGLGT